MLITLGRRGVNLDEELAKLNRAFLLRNEPMKARREVADVTESLRRKIAASTKPVLLPSDSDLVSTLSAGNRKVLAITAHPDDENMMSGLLAYAVDRGCAVRLLTLTHGEAGEDLAKDNNEGPGSLGQRRANELAQAAAVLGTQYEIAGFVNGAFRTRFPGRKFWLPDDVLSAWKGPQDPEQVVSHIVQSFAPHIVLTIEPNWGWTGNPEHRTAAELARRAVRGTGAILYYAVTADAAFTDQFHTGRQSEKRKKTYWEIKVTAARNHASQFRLPAGVEKMDPTQFNDLGIEHFKRAE